LPQVIAFSPSLRCNNLLSVLACRQLPGRLATDGQADLLANAGNRRSSCASKRIDLPSPQLPPRVASPSQIGLQIGL